MKKIYLLPTLFLALFYSCTIEEIEKNLSQLQAAKEEVKSSKEDPSTFTEVGSIDLGDAGASEISAYDSRSNRLFVVNNSNTSVIDIINLKNPSSPIKEGSIDITPYGGGVNSVAVNSGTLAAAVQGYTKTDNGKVVVFDGATLSKIAEIQVGALPDMVTFTSDGNFILSANEGEPNNDYSIDPIGSVSLISVKENYTVSTLDFSSFNSQKAELIKGGFRVFGPGADLAKDIEPEYITTSSDSKTAWVTLQENNAVAVIDINSKSISKILPLGFKDYSKEKNAIDASDKDGKTDFKTWPVKGMYLPDAISTFSKSNTQYFVTANEGDTREYDTFEEETRIKDVELVESVFPNAKQLQSSESLGRLKITSTLGKNAEGKYSALYSFGARSFSIWNALTGEQVYDSGNELEKKAVEYGQYDDDRSDDKGVEPEGITIGSFGNKTIAFIALERADAVLSYDITNVNNPKFLQLLKTGDAPEGILFVTALKSPNGKSMLIVSSEGDGTVKIFQPQGK